MRDGFYYKFWVYILSSRSGTLYVGITGYLNRRITQHKIDRIEGFTKKYPYHRPVYYESYQDVRVAIARQKQLERWRQEKKILLIEKLNSRWQDLAESWGGRCGFGGRAWGKLPESGWWRRRPRDIRDLRDKALVEIPCISMVEERFPGSLHSASVAPLLRRRSR